VPFFDLVLFVSFLATAAALAEDQGENIDIKSFSIYEEQEA